VLNHDKDSGVNDLAKRYHATLEAIALQNRHIIDTLNSKGHQITSIFMSGGQAKNLTLMQLFADVCGIPIVLPKDSGGAVVLGAAMLGRLAADGGNFGKEEQGQKLWDIMVCVSFRQFFVAKAELNKMAPGGNDAPGHGNCPKGRFQN